MINYFEAQIIEIHKHQWLESEKVGHDIGENVAAADWISKYAESFRAFWNNRFKKNKK